MTFNFQWCKKHRKPNPLESAIFCPGCALESVEEVARLREQIAAIRKYATDRKMKTLEKLAAE